MTQYSARKALKKKNKKKFQALNGAELDNEAEIKQLEVCFFVSFVIGVTSMHVVYLKFLFVIPRNTKTLRTHQMKPSSLNWKVVFSFMDKLFN